MTLGRLPDILVRVRKIPIRRAGELSSYILKVRKNSATRWSQEELAEQATRALGNFMESCDQDELEPEEVRAWTGFEITRHHIFHLEDAPGNLLGEHVSRGYLLGVALALRLDLDRINRLCGGLPVSNEMVDRLAGGM